MPLPSSGEIKVSEINTELDRASNTANSNFAGGTTPQSGSLFKLGEAGGINQTAPHKMSEWYGYNAVHLVYQSSITTPTRTYSSSSVWNIFNTSRKGIDCPDDIVVTANPSNIGTNKFSTMIIFSIEDSNGLNYSDAFDLYFYVTVTSNDDIRVGVATAFINNFGFLEYSQSSIIADFDTNLVDITSVSFNGSTLSSPNQYLIFYLQGLDTTNSADVDFYGVNTSEECGV
jgi:hypothetical protein